jgi:hypothetical protein
VPWTPELHHRRPHRHAQRSELSHRRTRSSSTTAPQIRLAVLLATAVRPRCAGRERWSRDRRGGGGRRRSVGRGGGRLQGVRRGGTRVWGKEGSAPLYVVGPTGPPGPRAIVPAHGPHRADRFRAGLGRHYGLKLQPSTAHSHARDDLGPKSSCWVCARVGPKFCALGQPMGLMLFGHL